MKMTLTDRGRLRLLVRKCWQRLQTQRQAFNANQSARRELLNWSERDARALCFYRQFISPDDVCFDVGANVGNRTKIFVRLSSKVIAVEPQKRCARVLATLQGRWSNLRVISKALGPSEGETDMFLSRSHFLSSLSRDWIETAKRSNRFGGDVWNQKRRVPITTLDQLISEHGLPSFVKIDVEGFEYEVIRGLTQPLGCLSIEFIPERLDATFKCLDRLSELAPLALNYSLGEEFSLRLSSWIKVEPMKETLVGLKRDTRVFGDVYVRFQAK
jgi:FkbM family methyltransferase